jgi:hypothetical protein
MSEVKSFELHIRELLLNYYNLSMTLKIQVKLLSDKEFEKLMHDERLDKEQKFYLYYFRYF